MALTVREQVSLSGYTTLGVGGPAARFVDAGTDDQVIAEVRDADAGARRAGARSRRRRQPGRRDRSLP